METKPNLQELQFSFIREVPIRLRAIRSAYELIDPRFWQPGCADMLLGLLHKLTGAAGTLGQQSLSIAAAQLYAELSEINGRELPSRESWNKIGHSLSHLEQLTLARLPKHNEALPNPAPFERLTHPMVYVVDDDREQTDVLSAALIDYGYQVRVFNDTDLFAKACHGHASPSVILMDMEFAEDKLAGARAIQELKSDPLFNPIVLFLSVHDDLPSRLAAFRSGANRYFTKPFDYQRLFLTMDELSGRIIDKPYRVLVVDDDEQTADAYAAGLTDSGMIVTTLSTPLDTIKRIEEFKPDVLVLDVYMPDATGPEIAAVIRENDKYAWLPILFLSAETDPSKHAVALSLGGDDFMVKPVRPSFLASAVRARAWRARRNKPLMSNATF